MRIFNNTIDKLQRICNFFRKNTFIEDSVLFVTDESTISPYIDELMRVINYHCYIEMMNFDSEGVLKVGKVWMETFGAIIFDRSLCKQSKVHSKFRTLIRSNSRRTFVLDLVSNQAGKSKTKNRFDIDLSKNMNDELRICKATTRECFGVPIPAKLSLSLTNAARKFEPFTIADNGSTFNRGIEILLIKSIARKMKIHLNYEDENLSPNGR